MRLSSALLVIATATCFAMFGGTKLAQAESTISCPPGTYDMLDWMTMDSDLRGNMHLTGSANPLYTDVLWGKFYWTKGQGGTPWDIQLYDNNFIYLWITEYDWNNPASYKIFPAQKMPLTARCAQAGFPGSRITVSDTTYQTFDNCSSFSTHDLRTAVNEVWGPYNTSFGGALPDNLPTLVVSYRYNCDQSYGNCWDKEEYYLTQRYGLAQWIHYSLQDGNYQQVQRSVFNNLAWGTTSDASNPDAPALILQARQIDLTGSKVRSSTNPTSFCRNGSA
ncbi:MAG: hypothetical protein M3O09_17530 [Acidobacteriota bacterium]|nr:hypothetical protein [Acidobacteriota bacterium]